MEKEIAKELFREYYESGYDDFDYFNQSQTA